MTATEVSLISALVSADFFKEKLEAKEFNSFALSIFKNPKYILLVNRLIDQGYITKECQLTLKGRLSMIHNPKDLSPRQLSMNTKSHLKESLLRNSLKTNNGIKGTLSYLNDEEFRQLTEDVLDELFDRCQNQDFYITESSAAYIQELQPKVEDELNIIQQQEVVDMITKEVVEVEVEDKPKRKKAVKV